MARAQLPLDPEAVKDANLRLWQKYPELKGRQLNANDDPKYKRYWMAQYQTAGGAVQDSKPLPPDAVEQPCPLSKKVNLEFRRVYWDGTPVPSLPYTVTLPDGSKATGTTDASGLARHPNVTPGQAIVVYGNDPNTPQCSIHTASDPDLAELFALQPDDDSAVTP